MPSFYDTYQDYLGNIVIIEERTGWCHIQCVVDDPIYQTWYVHYKKDLYKRTLNNLIIEGVTFDKYQMGYNFGNTPSRFIEPLLLNKHIEPVTTCRGVLGWHKSRLDKIAKQLGASDLQWYGN